MRKRLALASGLLWALLSTPSARAHDDDHGIELFLSNTGVDLDARGRARLDEDDGRQRFEVEVEDLTAGGYAVFVAGAPVGAFDVDSDGEGRLRLEGEPLPFDPRGKTIEVQSDPAGVVFFRGDFPTSRERARRKFKVREDFVNTGVDADAEGRAKLRVKRSKIRFQVKAKDLPQGSYDLVVGDTRVAGIQLAPEDDEPDEIEGKVKFDSRRARGSVRLLTFDPLCKRLAITQTAAGTTTTFLVIEKFGASEDLCSP